MHIWGMVTLNPQLNPSRFLDPPISHPKLELDHGYVSPSNAWEDGLALCFCHLLA